MAHYMPTTTECNSETLARLFMDNIFMTTTMMMLGSMLYLSVGVTRELIRSSPPRMTNRRYSPHAPAMRHRATLARHCRAPPPCHPRTPPSLSYPQATTTAEPVTSPPLPQGMDPNADNKPSKSDAEERTREETMRERKEREEGVEKTQMTAIKKQKN
ncbi:hypothetical protein DFH27DRAFT_612656 [Peziza echinospora]|nr:hypothetical protein DFH27DRAFT_612656 [Peziza echinospora]